MYCNPKVGGCGHAFCYACGIDWKKHINDHFYCNNSLSKEVKIKEINSRRLKEQLEIDLIEEEFKKIDGNKENDKFSFSFYYKKYNEYENSIMGCKILKNSLGEKISIISAIHNISFLDLSFLMKQLKV